MAISTVASEKAMYKTMFKDWLVSFILVFFMHYIIIVTIGVNNSLVGILDGNVGSGWSDSTMNKLAMMGIGINIDTVEISAIKSWASALVYAMMVFFTLAFLWTYVKRMITLAFLIVISPLVTVTYAIDKMGDGKSQALNAWLKEFIYNVLLQPFQCVIYLALMKSSITMLNTNEPSLGIAALVIICMMFTYEAEKIVRKIFGFDKASSIADTMATTAAMITGINTLSKIGGKGKTPAAVKNAGNKAASSANAGLAKNKIANKNISKAMQAAKTGIANSKAGQLASSAKSAISNSGVGSAASKVSNAVNNKLDDLKGKMDTFKQGVQNTANNGTPIKKMAANMALAAGNELKHTGDSIKKDIKGAISGAGTFTRSLWGPGAIQTGMTAVGIAAGLTTGNASNAITYGIAGNEIGAKMAAPVQEKYRDKQERKLADNYKDIANSFEELEGKMGNYDVTTEQGRENMKDKCKEITEKGPTKVNKEFEQKYNEYQNTLKDEIQATDPSISDREATRQARMQVKDKYNEILNGNIGNITSEIETLRNSGKTAEADALSSFAVAAKEKELSDNLTRMMGIEAALGDADSEKTVVTGENSTIDRINEGIAEENK